MGYAIELTFDHDLEAAIRDCRAALAGLGSGDPGVDEIAGRVGVPHITLACFDDLEVARVSAALPRLARCLVDHPVSIPSAGVFPGEPPVLFLAPVVSSALRRSRARFDDWSAELGLEPLALYRTEAWVPHCTLAHGLRADRLDAAWAVIRGFALPLEGRVAGVQLARFAPPPAQTLASEPVRSPEFQWSSVAGAHDPAVASCIALQAQVFEGMTAEHTAQLEAELARKGDLLHTEMCFAEGELVGFKMGWHRGPGQWHSWLGGVDPAWRRLGIADGLMRRQHAWCRANGYEIVRTVTVQRFQAMFALNLRHGFEVVGTMASPRGLKLVLEKRLVVEA